MNKKKLGIFIKKRRQFLNITQSSLAAYLNISIQAISRWEHGLSYPDFILLGDIAKYLKISIDDLLKCRSSNYEYHSNHEFNQNTFIDTIKKYLRQNKLSQIQIAKKLHVSQAYISNIINGKSLPTINQFIKLTKLFHVSYEDLYFSIYIEKEEIKKKYNYKFIIPILILIPCLLFAIIGINNNTNNNSSKKMINDNISYIEFWDENDNLLTNFEITKGNRIYTYPSSPSYLGWNKPINYAKYSSIYKANKNPFKLILRVFLKEYAFTYYYDNIDEFNMFEISDGKDYCKSLYYSNGDLFDINNINDRYLELYALTSPIKEHTISFDSYLNLENITIKDCDMFLKQLPVIVTDDYFIKGFHYNNKELKYKDYYSFESDIKLLPIFHNQDTIINNDGIITYLSSNEKEIIIPDKINNIQVKGIASNSINLNNINNTIIFLNKSIINFNNVFKNNNLLNNIKNIKVMNNSFANNSSLGNLQSINNFHIEDSEDLNSLSYPLINLSTNKDFKINNLYFHDTATNRFSFENLNLDYAHCTNGGFAHISKNMFLNSTLKEFIFTNNLLINSSSFSIDSGAFKNCVNLESFNFPRGTKLYGDEHFYNCTNLKNIYFYGDINCLSNNMFYNTNIDKIVSNYNIDTIKVNAFNNTKIQELQFTYINEFENKCYFPNSLNNIYIEKINTYPTNIQGNPTFHYQNADKITNSTYNICQNCLHLHKGLNDYDW